VRAFWLLDYEDVTFIFIRQRHRPLWRCLFFHWAPISPILAATADPYLQAGDSFTIHLVRPHLLSSCLEPSTAPPHVSVSADMPFSSTEGQLTWSIRSCFYEQSCEAESPASNKKQIHVFPTINFCFPSAGVALLSIPICARRRRGSASPILQLSGVRCQKGRRRGRNRPR
jgi:hypothetical protein